MTYSCARNHLAARQDPGLSTALPACRPRHQRILLRQGDHASARQFPYNHVRHWLPTGPTGRTATSGRHCGWCAGRCCGPARGCPTARSAAGAAWPGPACAAPPAPGLPPAARPPAAPAPAPAGPGPPPARATAIGKGVGVETRGVAGRLSAPERGAEAASCCPNLRFCLMKATLCGCCSCTQQAGVQA